MLKSVFKLLIGNVFSRIAGFFRFQLLIVLFGYTDLTDSIILAVSLVWFLNNFLLGPLIGRSLVKELAEVTDEKYNLVLRKYISSVVNLGGTGLLIVLGYYFVYKLDFRIGITPFELLIILIALCLLGMNEIFSLYNQFRERYLVYSINAGIWNLFLILGVVAIFSLNLILSPSIYLGVFVLGIIATLLIQMQAGGLKFDLFYALKLAWPKWRKTTHNQYSVIFALYSVFLIVDLFYLKKESSSGDVAFYSALTRIPELTSSVLIGTLVPVVVNNLFLKKANAWKWVGYLVLFILLSYFVIHLSFSYNNMWLFTKLFGLTKVPSRLEMLWPFIWFACSSIMFLNIRLSVLIKNETKLLIIFITTLVLKISILLFFRPVMRDILFYNALIYVMNVVVFYVISVKNFKDVWYYRIP